MWGLVYLMGQPLDSSNGQLVSVINGKTGADMTSALSAGFGGASTFPSFVSGIYSGIRHRAYVSRMDIQTEIVSFSVNADNVASAPVSTGYRKPYSPLNFFLNQSEDLLFTRNGNFFHADTLEYVGTLTLNLHFIGSFSQSNSADETILLLYGAIYDPATRSYPPLYEPSYQRFTGSKYDVAADIDLPVIGGLQTYGIGIYHSANSRRVALVQAGSDVSYETGLAYYLVAR